LRGGYAVAGRYHSTEGKDGVLSWAHAVAQAQAGARFTEILAEAYPRASVAALGGRDAAACEPMVLAQQWLQRQQLRWQPQLVAYSGFSVPGPVQVCRLQSGNPHAHSSTGRIDVTSFDSLEQRVAMAHEYLHLGFARHPRGLDETFIENLARQLMGVQQ
jgi:uncharacterized protein YfaQ (DUF2300 family)